MPQNPRQVTCSNLFTPGRACAATAVVLHEWSSGIENLDHEMCRCLRPRPLTSPGCHTSFHFGIGGNCNFRQYVSLSNTAWGFYFVPAPLCPIPPCPINQLCDGIGSDQYNPQENGTLPTPVVSAGSDLSANCSVIHVAIATGAARTGSGLFCIDSPNFSENAYRCLVESLCYIYKTAGLVPNGYSNLLTHIGELMELDLDQLAIDIQACMNFVPAPLPTCDCAPSISATLGNLSTAVADGLYTSFTVTDTPTVDLVKTGSALSANVKIYEFDGNQLINDPVGGLYVSLWPVVPNVCSSASPAPLDGIFYLGNIGTGYSHYRKADPVQIINVNTINILTQYNTGKNTFLVNSPDNTLLLTNLPTPICAEKSIFIKNTKPNDLVITSDASTIDFQATFTLVASTGSLGGGGVHLVWDGGKWVVLSKYR